MTENKTMQKPVPYSMLRILSAKKHKVLPYHFTWTENQDIEVIRNRICQDLMDKTIDVTEIAKDFAEDGSFKSIDYLSEDKKTWHAIEHLANLKKLQIAIHSEGNPFFMSAELKEKVLKGLNYWVEKNYVCSFSGWYNTIGLGLYIPDILIFGVDGFQPESREKLFVHFKPTLIQNETVKARVLEREVDATAANLFDEIVASMKVALIENDGNTLTWLKHIVENELRVFPSYKWPMHRYDAEGIREDMSFQQHFQLVYFGGYGEVFLNGAARYLNYTKDTQYQVKNVCTDLLADFVLDGIQFPMRNGYRDFNCSGRGCSRKNGALGIQTSLSNVVNALLSYPTVQRRQELEALVRNRFHAEKDKGAGGHRYFYESDYQVMNNENYMAAVRHASKNTRIFEFLNDENALGFYMGLGGIYYYVDGDEYLNTPPVYNWNQVPGTTTRQGLIPKRSWVKSYNEVGNTRLVGGISNGTIGASYFQLKQQGVSAKKAYFMFKKGVVCLGTSISCSKPNEIVTSINQCLLKGDVTIGEKTLPLQEQFEGLCPFVYHNKIAYFTDRSMQVSAKTVQGDWARVYIKLKDDFHTENLFTIGISHGKKPHGDSYAYTVLLNTTLEEARAYAAEPLYKVLANSNAVQAVSAPKENATIAIFHRAGVLSIHNAECKVNHACAVMIEEVDGKAVLTFAAHDGKSRSLTCTYQNRTKQIALSKRPQRIVWEP